MIVCPSGTGIVLWGLHGLIGGWRTRYGIRRTSRNLVGKYRGFVGSGNYRVLGRLEAVLGARVSAILFMEAKKMGRGGVGDIIYGFPVNALAFVTD